MRSEMRRLSVDLVAARDMADMLLLPVGIPFTLYAVGAGAGHALLLLLILDFGVAVRVHHTNADRGGLHSGRLTGTDGDTLRRARGRVHYTLQRCGVFGLGHRKNRLRLRLHITGLLFDNVSHLLRHFLLHLGGSDRSEGDHVVLQTGLHGLRVHLSHVSVQHVGGDNLDVTNAGHLNDIRHGRLLPHALKLLRGQHLYLVALEIGDGWL